MTLTFLPTPQETEVAFPKTEKLDPLVDRDFTNPDTVATVTYDGLNVRVDGEVVLVKPGITELAAAFDQLEAVALGFVIGTDVSLYWFDTLLGDFTTTDFGPGSNPRLDLDQNNVDLGPAQGSQILFSYLRDGQVFYRSQLERYGTEHSVPDITAATWFKTAGLGRNNRFTFQASGDLSSAPPDSTSTGDIEFEADPSTPEAPVNFLRLFQHLLPRAKAWGIVTDKPLRRFFKALSNVAAGVKGAADCAYLQLRPESTTLLPRWEDQFNLGINGLSIGQRREQLAARWSATGSLGPEYLQDVLQGLGFDVYVHQWWLHPEGSGGGPINLSIAQCGDSLMACGTLVAQCADPDLPPPSSAPGSPPRGSVTPVAPDGFEIQYSTDGCPVPLDPRGYLSISTTQPTAATGCGEPFMQCGEPLAQCGETFGAPAGYPLVNKIPTTVRRTVAQCGEPFMQCGEPLAQCGQTAAGQPPFQDELIEYEIPNDPAKWPYFVYISGPTFPELATVPSSRRDEFEATLLRYVPAHLWIGVLVSYN